MASPKNGHLRRGARSVEVLAQLEPDPRALELPPPAPDPRQLQLELSETPITDLLTADCTDQEWARDMRALERGLRSEAHRG